MRFLYFLLLLILLAPVAILAWQNHEIVPIHYLDHHFLDQSIDCPLPLLVGAAYLLGMFSGWSVVGLFRRSIQGVTDSRNQ